MDTQIQDLRLGGDANKYRLHSCIVQSYSPCKDVPGDNIWIPGNFHNHIQHLRDWRNNAVSPGNGGRIPHNELLQIMHDYGHHFMIASGHEVMPGNSQSWDGRFPTNTARAFDASDFPDDDFVILNSMENQDRKTGIISGNRENWNWILGDASKLLSCKN